MSCSEIVRKARETFNSLRTRSYQYRMKQLQNLYDCLEQNEEKFVEALRMDNKKPYLEADLMDVAILGNEVLNAMYYLKDWMQEKKVMKPIFAFQDKAYVAQEPLGVVLIISAWNYPVQLLLNPFVGAIAAGCCVILKPSEGAPNVSKIMAELLPKYMDNDCYHVVEGGADVTQQLLKEKFDHVFYTGSPRVGQLVYQAASKTMTPVSLEMSGKSPVYIDDTVNIDYAIRRMLWGKFVSVGQTCIAPDYVLCTKKIQDEIVKRCKGIVTEWYGSDERKSEDYGRIGNLQNFQKILRLLEGCEIAVGGDYDVDTLYIEPTIVINVKETDPIMQEEVFGPVLPIMTVSGLQEAMDFVNNRSKPLAIYVFSNDEYTVNTVMYKTFSGGMAVNETIMHAALETLPFGGVGASGFGDYHGKFTFDLFTHFKPVMHRNLRPINECLTSYRFPPYNDTKLKIGKMLQRKCNGVDLQWLVQSCVFAFGMYSAYCYHFYVGI